MNHKTRELAFNLGHGYCMCSKGCTKRATEIHHKLPNTKPNKSKFPLFIESIFNLCPINNCCHLNGIIPKIGWHEAAIYEEWLRNYVKRME